MIPRGSIKKRVNMKRARIKRSTAKREEVFEYMLLLVLIVPSVEQVLATLLLGNRKRLMKELHDDLRPSFCS